MDFLAAFLPRGSDTAEALRSGGRLVRDSERLPVWALFTSQVGVGVESCLLALTATASLIGVLFVRMVIDSKAFR